MPKFTQLVGPKGKKNKKGATQMSVNHGKAKQSGAQMKKMEKKLGMVY